MTGKKTLWLILAIGITALIAALWLLYSGGEDKIHEGARFVWVQVNQSS